MTTHPQLVIAAAELFRQLPSVETVPHALDEPLWLLHQALTSTEGQNVRELALQLLTAWYRQGDEGMPADMQAPMQALQRGVNAAFHGARV